MNKQRLASWLRDMMKSRGLTADSLAKLAGVSPSTVERLLGDYWKGTPQRDTLVAIADALGVPASELFRVAGMDASTRFRYDVNDIIVEAAQVLRDVPERYYPDALRYLRRQIDTARELFVKEEELSNT